MRAGGGAEKGAAFERHCCKRLSLWVTNGQYDDCFWRTAMSGGRATFQLSQDIINRAQAGDMTAISAEGIAFCESYVWEYKHRANLNFTAFMAHSGGLLAGYWHTVQKLADRLGKQPVLIAKQDFYPALVLCPMTSTLFPYEPWAVFPRYAAELYDFETVTAVFRPTIKRPRGANAATPPQIQSSDDQRSVVFHRNSRAEAR